MKSILIIILFGFLIGCASSNAINTSDLVYISEDGEVLDTLQQDSIKLSENVVFEDESNEQNELQRLPIHNIEDIKSEKDVIDAIEKHEKDNNLKVIDKTTISDVNKGWIVYSVPESMKVQKNYSVKVRISKKSTQSKAVLILGKDDAINNPEYPSVAIIEDIRVSGDMSAELRADNDVFKIVSLSTPTQNIDDESYTEWEWIVSPKKSGKSPLKLVVKLKDTNKDIVVFNKNIKVISNMPVAVEGFFDKYWQWIMTTIIIPIFIYFWNKKRKKRQTKKS